MTEDGHPAIGPLPPSPRRPKPLVTNLLVVANVVVFLLQIFRWGLENSIAWYGQDQVAIWDGELWRLLTAPFLHGGWGHLVINCLGLFLLGEIIESYLGKRRLLAVYGVAGIAGGLMFQAFPATIGVGASGAVYGLAGVLLVLRFGHVVDGRFRLRPSFYLVALTLSLLDWLFAELLARAALVHVATTAHLGGLVSGMVIGYIFQHPERPVSSGRRWTLGLAGSVCLIAVFAYSCYYPFLNPVWPVWRRIQIGVAEGRVDTADTRAAELLSPDLVRRVISNLVEAGKQIEARGRAAEDQTEDQEARERSFAAARRRYEQAVGIWNHLRGGGLKRVVGYPLFDELMGIEADDLAKEVLAELIETYRELPPALQNDVALLSLPMKSRRENELMVNALQRCSSIVVQNSLREGFGLTVTEAMWKQAAVVGSRACGIRQQIRDDVEGRLIPDAGDPETIAELLDLTLEDLAGRARLGHNAQRRVHDDFLVFTQIRRWLEVLCDQAGEASA